VLVAICYATAETTKVAALCKTTRLNGCFGNGECQVDATCKCKEGFFLADCRGDKSQPKRKQLGLVIDYIIHNLEQDKAEAAALTKKAKTEMDGAQVERDEAQKDADAKQKLYEAAKLKAEQSRLRMVKLEAETKAAFDDMNRKEEIKNLAEEEMNRAQLIMNKAEKVMKEKKQIRDLAEIDWNEAHEDMLNKEKIWKVAVAFLKQTVTEQTAIIKHAEEELELLSNLLTMATKLQDKYTDRVKQQKQAAEDLKKKQEERDRILKEIGEHKALAN